jgi:hypothetical protein
MLLCRTAEILVVGPIVGGVFNDVVGIVTAGERGGDKGHR